MPNYNGSDDNRHDIPTRDGIELHFNDYQVGPHDLPVITVPWAVFDGIPINNVR